MMAAMENAYKGTLMQGKFPGGILCLEMPADLVDVNVHPAKTEVRFAREGEVFDAVYSAVKQALAAPGTGECRFDPEEKPAANSGLSALRPAAGPAPQQAAAPRQAEKEGGFVSMSAQEYRQKVMGAPAAQPPKPAPVVTEVYSPLLGGKLRSPLSRPGRQPLPRCPSPKKRLRRSRRQNRSRCLPSRTAASRPPFCRNRKMNRCAMWAKCSALISSPSAVASFA